MPINPTHTVTDAGGRTHAVCLGAPGFSPGNAPTEEEADRCPPDPHAMYASRFRFDSGTGLWFDWGPNPQTSGETRADAYTKKTGRRQEPTG